jgi:(p)ppGpp synthase/HD superfamily hydrolase
LPPARSGAITSNIPAKSKDPTLDDAILLASEAHHGVMDKSGQPYILHPLRVMFQCETQAERIVAVLHDVVEDTDRTFDDLRNMGYSEEVLAALDCVTKRDGESYEQFVERAAANPIARRVKIADIEDNMDVRRLPNIGPKDWERTTKYLAAWKRLKQAT